MISVNVELNSKPWLKKIKNPKKYLQKKSNEIFKKISLFQKKKITFTILLTNSLNIKKLNKKFRNNNKSTDVLSFPYLSNGMVLSKNKDTYIGDIAICYEIIEKRSKKDNFFLEFDKVWVHGLLHLLGFDHIKNSDFYKMEKIEKKILKIISN